MPLRLLLPRIHHCRRPHLHPHPSPRASLRLSSSAAHPRPQDPASPPDGSETPDSALSRRFTAMAEDALTASPCRASTIAAENDFPADLKRDLAARLASADYDSTPTTATSPPASTPHHTQAPPPVNLNLRPTHTSTPSSTAHRIARAKEKSTEYTLSKTVGLTDQERAEMRHMFRERFLPAGRAVASFQALASLADAKIEDARRRGQFNNLANRGRPLERDHNAESPFLDTTEYLLNRIIKQQDIAPPWIEKQQELVGAVARFRERLRAGWRRHVARSIASAGGDLEAQCRRAEGYSRAEERLRRIEERAKKLEVGEAVEDIEDVVMAGSTEVFRDPAWEAIELSYHKLAIEDLNSTTRSYNLMAPGPARKPYLSLERELKNCFRDCAPVIVKDIRDRAVRPSANSDFKMKRSNGPGGLLEKLDSETAVIHDSTEPNYGFKEFWSGLWGKKGRPG